MNYAKVSVQLPADSLPQNSIGKKVDEVKLNFFPMGGMTGKNVTALPIEEGQEQSFEQYREKFEPYDAQMMEWMQDPEHALSFYHDPLAAFQEAVNPPEDLISMLKELQENSKKGNLAEKIPENNIASCICDDIVQDTLNQIADYTCGWDIVIGMRQDAVNKGLQYVYKRNLLPHKISGEYESPLKGSDKIKVDADINPPVMVGGTGGDVTVGVTVQKGTLELTGTSPTKAEIGGLTMKLTLRLSKIKSPVQPEKGTRYDFMLDIADKEAFVGFKLENVPPVLIPSPIIQAFVEAAMLGLLTDSFVGKQYKVFSADLKGAGEYEFLIPKEIDYAGQSKPGALPAVGALIITSNGQKGAIQLDANLFPTQDLNAVLAMSRDLFLKNVGISGLASAFKVNKNYFDYNSNSHCVYNTQEFNYYEKVKDYTVKIKSAKMKIEEGELVIEIAARVEPSAGIYIDYTIYSPYQVSLQENKGKQTIHFDVDKSRYHEKHKTSAEWWVWLLAFLATSIGALILIIILEIINSVAPDIGVDAFSNAINDVQWSYIKIVKLKTIEFGDCIRIGCDAEFQKD